ncbi:MAG: ribonuclease H-like domain-containing protein [Pseudomonadota bacterium]
MTELRPRILFLDIETRPIVAEVWSLRDISYIGLNQVREFGGTICVGTKWGGQQKVQLFSDWEHGHRPMLQAIHDLMSQADAVCGYNSDRFDIKKLKGEFVKNEFPPPKPITSIDVFKVVRREFSFDSHKLDHVADLLGVGRKVQHEGHGLWMKVGRGDEKAQRMMERYCKQDVRLLEKVYDKLLPWMATHPKLRIDRGTCHKCGSANLTSQGWKPAVSSRVQSLKCGDCGGWQQGKRERLAA